MTWQLRKCHPSPLLSRRTGPSGSNVSSFSLVPPASLGAAVQRERHHQKAGGALLRGTTRKLGGALLWEGYGWVKHRHDATLKHVPPSKPIADCYCLSCSMVISALIGFLDRQKLIPASGYLDRVIWCCLCETAWSGTSTRLYSNVKSNTIISPGRNNTPQNLLMSENRHRINCPKDGFWSAPTSKTIPHGSSSSTLRRVTNCTKADWYHKCHCSLTQIVFGAKNF